jgi:hypothetical protein
MNTSTTFDTESASRHLKSLCNHFGRKVDAECNATAGWVQFRIGRCDMTADENKLALTVSAEDQKNLDQVVQIVTSHLERFAFRENPVLAWQTQAA